MLRRLLDRKSPQVVFRAPSFERTQPLGLHYSAGTSERTKDGLSRMFQACGDPRTTNANQSRCATTRAGLLSWPDNRKCNLPKEMLRRSSEPNTPAPDRPPPPPSDHTLRLVLRACLDTTAIIETNEIHKIYCRIMIQYSGS